jgi:hypothetical protein
MSPAEKQAREMMADRKAAVANERAYNAASQTAPAPAERPAPAAPRRPAAVEEAIQEVQDAKMRKRISDMGYAKGGKVSSASRRADGIATKGKTKGRMI